MARIGWLMTAEQIIVKEFIPGASSCRSGAFRLVVGRGHGFASLTPEPATPGRVTGTSR
jgi:hypothetical protein